MQLLKSPPKYLINPAAKRPSVWMADMSQMIIGHPNPNYLNSVWLGVVNNVLIIPHRIFYEILTPLFHFRFQVLLMTLWALPLSVLLMLVESLAGKLSAHTLPVETLRQSLMLTPEQSKEAIEAGCTDFLLELEKIELDQVSGVRL